ncbi:MAG: 50S ribosomal protein L24 [Verrucomicrobiota bacterium]
MSHFHVKKGDEVVVIAGRDAGRRGKILRIAGKKGRAVVEGLHMIKRHTKKNQQNPQGAIVEREGTAHISNLMAAEKFDARAAARAGGTGEAAAETPSQT